MLRVFARPQAESVVVLRREDESLEARRLHRFHPLVAIERGGVKNLLVLCALAPFAVRVGVHTVMHKRIAFHLKPIKLSFRRHHTCRLFQKFNHTVLPNFGFAALLVL